MCARCIAKLCALWVNCVTVLYSTRHTGIYSNHCKLASAFFNVAAKMCPLTSPFLSLWVEHLKNYLTDCHEIWCWIVFIKIYVSIPLTRSRQQQQTLYMKIYVHFSGHLDCNCTHCSSQSFVILTFGTLYSKYWQCCKITYKNKINVFSHRVLHEANVYIYSIPSSSSFSMCNCCCTLFISLLSTCIHYSPWGTLLNHSFTLLWTEKVWTDWGSELERMTILWRLLGNDLVATIER
jgi:hypothetical protein